MWKEVSNLEECVECVICGHKVKTSLTRHLRKRHNISRSNYEKTYKTSAVAVSFSKMLADRNKSDKMREITIARNKSTKMRNVVSKRNQDPDFIEKCRNGILNNLDERSRRSQRRAKKNSENWKNQAYRDTMIQKISDCQKEIHADPEYKKLRSEIMLNTWKNPENAKKMLNAPKTSPFGKSCHYFSKKFDHTFYCRSQGEYEFLLALETLNTVLCVESESIHIVEETKVYTPDFLVTSNENHKYLVEVKYEEPYTDHIEKVEMALRYCKSNDMKFCYVRRFVEIPKLLATKDLNSIVLF